MLCTRVKSFFYKNSSKSKQYFHVHTFELKLEKELKIEVLLNLQFITDWFLQHKILVWMAAIFFYFYLAKFDFLLPFNPLPLVKSKATYMQINQLNYCSWTRTNNHLVRKRTLSYLDGWLFVYEISGCGFESSCSHSNFRFRACIEQGVPWHSGNYRVWIHSEMRKWHDKNIQSTKLPPIFQKRKICSNRTRSFPTVN